MVPLLTKLTAGVNVIRCVEFRVVDDPDISFVLIAIKFVWLVD